MTPRAHDVDVGIRLRLWDHGGEGPVVLIVHGYLDTGRSHDALAALLLPDHRVLALDWRGHGASAHVGAGGSYHLLDHMKDLTGILARIPVLVGRAVDVVVGHSMGGNIALLVAGSLPDVIPRLVLLDTLGPPSEEVSAQPERLGSVLRAHGDVKPFKRLASRDEAVARVRATNPGLSEEGARRMTAHGVVENDDGTVSFALDDRLKGPAPVRYDERFYESLCARVTAPVHLVRAENGYVSLDDEPGLSRARWLDCVAETVSDIGHNVHVDAPEACARAVRASLTQPAHARGRRDA